LAESTEHKFLADQIGKSLEQFSATGLLGVREADRRAFDYACRLERDFSRSLVLAGAITDQPLIVLQFDVIAEDMNRGQATTAMGYAGSFDFFRHWTESRLRGTTGPMAPSASALVSPGGWPKAFWALPLTFRAVPMTAFSSH
jgi:hypothetical protein